jgi:hypothetical protein
MHIHEHSSYILIVPIGRTYASSETDFATAPITTDTGRTNKHYQHLVGIPANCRKFIAKHKKNEGRISTQLLNFFPFSEYSQTAEKREIQVLFFVHVTVHRKKFLDNMTN